MILSGTLIGLICVFALLMAAVVLALLSRNKEKKGAPFLSKMALILFLVAFVLGVVVTLVGGIQPRQEAGMPMAQAPMAGGTSDVDSEELKKLQEAIAKNPQDVVSLERLGHLYLKMQDYQNVFDLAHKALQLNPQATESRVPMGMVLFTIGEVDSALQQLDQALSIKPNDLEALSFKGMVQLQGKNDPEAARKSWNEYLKIAKPGDPGWGMVQMFLSTLE